MSTALRWMRLIFAAALVTLATVFVAVSAADARTTRHHRRVARTQVRIARHHRRVERTHVRIARGKLQMCSKTSRHAAVLVLKRSRHSRSHRHGSDRRHLRVSDSVTSIRYARAHCVSTGTPTTSTGTAAPTAPVAAPTAPTAPTSSGGSSSAVQSDLAMGSGGNGWDGYGADSVPGADWRPYADSSPFNQTVAGASILPNSQTYVNDALQWGDPSNMATTANTTMDYSHPTYYAQPTDPTYTLQATGGYSQAIQGQQIQIPAYAKPADGGDAHMTVIEPDGWEYDFWQVQSMSNGVLTFTAGGRTMITGDGLGSNGTAAHFGNLAGIIRAPELEAGQIDHALFIVLKCTSSDTSFGYGTQTSPASSSNGSYVYPAENGGAPCPSGESSVPLGTRFMLDMTPSQIQALDVPTWKKTILTALATYGGYVGDTGGSGFGFMFESSMTYTQLGQADPLATFAASNNLPTWNNTYIYSMSNGVDWQQYLKVITPPAES